MTVPSLSAPGLSRQQAKTLALASLGGALEYGKPGRAVKPPASKLNASSAKSFPPCVTAYTRPLMTLTPALTFVVEPV